MENMDKLEEFITANREALNTYQLPEGHAKRFLRKQQKHHHRLTKRAALLAAASISIFLAITGIVGITYNRYYYETFSGYFTDKDNKQFYEIEAYYRSQLLQKYRAIEQIASNKVPSVNIEAKAVVSEFEKEKLHLQKELKQTPRQDAVIGALVLNYEAKMKALQRIQESINSLNNTKQ